MHGLKLFVFIMADRIGKNAFKDNLLNQQRLHILHPQSGKWNIDFGHIKIPSRNFIYKEHFLRGKWIYLEFHFYSLNLDSKRCWKSLSQTSAHWEVFPFCLKWEIEKNMWVNSSSFLQEKSIPAFQNFVRRRSVLEKRPRESKWIACIFLK